MSTTMAPLLRGRPTQSSGADNATATASVSAITAQKHLVMGVEAHYSATVSAIKTVTVKHGSTTWQTFRWDFSNGPFFFSFPVAFRSDTGEAVSAELEASGTGGTSGYVTIYSAQD